MTELKRTECCVCGVEFAIPAAMYTKQQQEGGFHYCPNGHNVGWRKDGCANARLRRERDRLQQREAQLRDELAAAGRKLATEKGRVTRLKNRAAAGSCPCCNRSFQNLQRHMASKHPDFTGKPPRKGRKKALRDLK